MTLKLKNFQEKVNLPQMEHDVLRFWDETEAFKKSIESRPENKPYVFYDGPPFATGLPHYGHIVASTTKDVIPRYWTMKGYRVERQWGWDCHGLPIENIIEKELGLKDRQAILDYGIENFNNACKEAVLRYVTEWKEIIHRLGRWVDMENDYKTMEPWYMESLWWVFKMLWERNLIYKGHKSMHICPRCSTPLSNFEVTQGYKEVKDISVYVSFKVKNAKEKLGLNQPVSLIAWTTTPWTLPGNVLLAVQPDETYVLFKPKDSETNLLVAKKRLGAVVDTETCILGNEFKGKELAGLTYEPIFPYFKDSPNSFRVVTAGFVTMEEGSGIVHIAPAFGEDDYNIGKQEGIPLVQHVGMDGKFTSDVTDFAGRLVKPKDNPLETDIELIKYLQAHESLFKKQNITHTYPHCWRCDTPLINYATTSWFVKVTHIKQALLDNNHKINWVPDHIKDGRFGKWLENARDWAISRNRFWGTPLPVWQSDDGDTICVGSMAELEQLSGKKVADLHKHVVDQIEIVKDGKTYKRIPEVLDCWYESGAMPYASFHYPFDNKEKFEHSFPAEFISEGQDQTRGWFYTLHVLATALTFGDNKAIPVQESTSSFKNVIVNGIVLAEDGKKMSKRLQNYPDPMVIAEKYGVDALRFYLMNSTVMRAENLNFSERDLKDIYQKVVNTLWNTFAFYKLYAGNNQVPSNCQPKVVMDKWIVSRTHSVITAVTKAFDNYDTVAACRELQTFINDLSTWYLRRSRDRFKEDQSSLEVFGWVLNTLVHLLAPVTPFVTEAIFQNLTDQPQSLHLETWPVADPSLIDTQLETKMDLVRKVVEKLHALRQQHNLRVRQPLAAWSLDDKLAKSFTGFENLLDIINDEVNVKTFTANVQKSADWQNGDLNPDTKVWLNTKLTPELVEEGEARELVRQIQDVRKKLNVAIDQKVTVTLPTWPEKFTDYIKTRTLAETLVKGGELKVETI
jgi:isoleucyl-tRNA synthetase